MLLDEAAIAAAMRQYIEAEGQTIEGAAGVAVAALLQSADTLRGKTVAVVVCGGNVSPATLESVLAPGTDD